MNFIKFSNNLIHSKISKLKACKLEKDSISQLSILLKLNNWNYNENKVKINKLIEFKDFDECFKNMSTLAQLSEVMCHHPEWFNVYNRLDIDLGTHDVNGVSIKDLIFAKGVDILINNDTKIDDLVSNLDDILMKLKLD